MLHAKDEVREEAVETPVGGETPVVTSYQDLSFTRSTSDTAKVALIIAIMGAVLAAALFFNVRSDVSDVSSSLSVMESQLTTRVDGVETRMADFEKLPQQMRNRMLQDAVEEMSLKSQFLGTQVQTPDQKAALEQINTLLETLSKDLAAQ